MHSLNVYTNSDLGGPQIAMATTKVLSSMYCLCAVKNFPYKVLSYLPFAVVLCQVQR